MAWPTRARLLADPAVPSPPAPAAGYFRLWTGGNATDPWPYGTDDNASGNALNAFKA